MGEKTKKELQRISQMQPTGDLFLEFFNSSIGRQSVVVGDFQLFVQSIDVHLGLVLLFLSRVSARLCCLNLL